MINDITVTYLLNWALDHDISYVLTSELSSFTPSCSLPSKRKMIINSNWHDKSELPFQIAHEIGHILNKDSGKQYFCLANTTNPVENKANHAGIKLLIEYYFADVPKEQWNVNNFINYYHIPSELEDWCISYLKSLT